MSSIVTAPASSGASAFAMPKSSSFGNSWPARSMTMTLLRLMSRCTMPSSCAVCTTSHTRPNSAPKIAGGIGPRRLTSSSSVAPRTYSIAIHSSPSGSAPNA